MKKIYVSELAAEPLTEFLISCGHEVTVLHKTTQVYESIASHPDIYMCKINGQLIMSQGDLGYSYPENIKYNGVQLGGFFLHNLHYTAPSLLAAVHEAGLLPVQVAQGYTKCNIVLVDENAIITSDKGIARAVMPLGVEVLLISPGHVNLAGFPYGFLGGASGRVGDVILFNGNLSAHPDYPQIAAFIQKRGLALRYFEEYELEDIGSIIEVDEQ